MKPQSQPTPLSMLGTSAFVVAEPKGRALLISPWNFPFNLAIGPLVAALAAGCTAILKPSEHAPHTAQLVQDLVSELFAPHEVAVAWEKKKWPQNYCLCLLTIFSLPGARRLEKL